MARPTSSLRPWRSALLALVAVGCASVPPAPERRVPTPASVTKDDPGGDASDPREGALRRLLGEPFGTRTDKFHTLRFRLPDWKNWRRVRFWGYPTRAGYRYGDGHYAVAALFYQPSEPGDAPGVCLDRFVARARAVAKIFSLELAHVRYEIGTSHPRLSVLQPTPKPRDAAPDARPAEERVDKAMPIVRAEASFETLANQGRWLVAAAAYASWPGTCLVQGIAVDGDDYPELARAVVDRWVSEGAGRLIWERALWEAPPFENR